MVEVQLNEYTSIVFSKDYGDFNIVSVRDSGNGFTLTTISYDVIEKKIIVVSEKTRIITGKQVVRRMRTIRQYEFYGREAKRRYEILSAIIKSIIDIRKYNSILRVLEEVKNGKA